MKRKILILTSLVCVLLATSLAIGGYEQAKKEKEKAKEDIYSQVELLAHAISIIKQEYVSAVDAKKLVYGGLSGMLGSLDDFSSFLEPEEHKEMKVEAKGEFGGIGIELALREGVLTVIAPMDGTPADKAGMMAGDKIVKIDGVVTRDIKIDDAIKKMRGDPGTALTLTVWREKEGRIIDLPIKRDIIKLKSIKTAQLLEDKVGYIKLIEFQEKSHQDLEEALKKLEAQGMDALIFDLRNNPGGLLDAAVGVAEKFLPKETLIVSIKSRTEDQNLIFRSDGRSTHPNYPLIILVNGGSASASEIVAGAVQDNKRGIILGTKTFGKGSVQTVIPLKDDSALRLTTATYYTPSGRMISHQGIIPDVAVEREDVVTKPDEKDKLFDNLDIDEKPMKEPPQDAKIKPEEKTGLKMDTQLLRALDLIKAIKVYKTIKT